MNIFGINLLFAIVWAALTGTVTLGGLAVGFVIGFAVLWLTQPLIGASRYHSRVVAWIKLVIMFHYELFVSSMQVIMDIITPRHLATPALIEMPLDVKTDAGILLVTNLISLTPGTLSVDVSEDRTTLLIHAMFADDPDGLCQSLKSGMEKWVIDALEGDV